MVAAFDVADVNPNPARFDLKKAESINGDHIRLLDVDDFAERTVPYLVAAGVLDRAARPTTSARCSPRPRRSCRSACSCSARRPGCSASCSPTPTRSSYDDDALRVAARERRRGARRVARRARARARGRVDARRDRGRAARRAHRGPRAQAARRLRPAARRRLRPPRLAAAVRVDGDPRQGRVDRAPRPLSATLRRAERGAMAWRRSTYDVVVIGGGPGRAVAPRSTSCARAARVLRARQQPAAQRGDAARRTASSPATASRRSSCARSAARRSRRTTTREVRRSPMRRRGRALEGGEFRRHRVAACAARRTSTCRRRPCVDRDRAHRDAAGAARASAPTTAPSCTAASSATATRRRTQPLALIGETDDLAERALLLSQWSSDLIVFTNGVGRRQRRRRGAARRARRPRRAPARSTTSWGSAARMTGVRLADGDVIAAHGRLRAPAVVARRSTIVDGLGPRARRRRLPRGRRRGPHVACPASTPRATSTPPGPQQLIVAAGAGRAWSRRPSTAT